MNWSTLQQQDEMIHLQLAQYKKWSKQKEALEKQLKHADLNIERYERLLKESALKIEKLEDESFLNKVKSLFQNKQEELTNLLEASAERELKLTEAQIVKEDLQDELVDLVYKLNALDEKERQAKLELNKIQMKMWLEQHAPNVASKLQQLKEQKNLAQQLLQEIGEAIEAGQSAKSALVQAASELNTAKDYSTWDTFLGGGVFATHIKHEKLRVANTYLHKAQRELQKFQNELLDLKGIHYRTLNVNVDGFVTFSDYFFDDIFSAWSIHSKLNKSRQQVGQIMDDISNALLKLKSQYEITEGKLAQICTDIEKIYNSNVESLKL